MRRDPPPGGGRETHSLGLERERADAGGERRGGRRARVRVRTLVVQVRRHLKQRTTMMVTSTASECPSSQTARSLSLLHRERFCQGIKQVQTDGNFLNEKMDDTKRSNVVTSLRR